LSEVRSDRDPHERLVELLDELRVILPGVTVLFAFLLAVPFHDRFDQVSAGARAAYFLGFGCTALALVLLVGESAYHRLRGKGYDKTRMLRTTSHQAVAALGLLAVAVSAVSFLVTSVLYGTGVATAAAAGLFGFAIAVWFALPLWRRFRHG